MFILEAISALLFISNAFTIYYYRAQLKDLKKERPLDKDATELLRDLINGNAVAVIKVIDPKSIFLWSSKDSQR